MYCRSQPLQLCDLKMAPENQKRLHRPQKNLVVTQSLHYLTGAARGIPGSKRPSDVECKQSML